MRVIRRHFGVILVAIALVAMGFGTAGFLACDAASGIATALYRSVQLFYWNYFPWNTTAEATIPWTLELARWLAPVATLGALSRVAMAIFHRRWDAFRARRLRGHFVICGAGDKGAALAEELEEGGEWDVLIVEKNEQRAEALVAKGSLVILGDATRPEVLRHAGVPHAAKLVITTGDDHDNLMIALAAAHLCSGGGQLSIHAHSSDASLCDLYRRNQALSALPDGAASVRVFNHFRNVARRTLHDFPPEPGDGEAHVVLPDLSRLAGALAVECALVGHFTGDRRLHLHFVGPGASQDLATLRSRHPSLERCVAVESIDLGAEENFAVRVAALIREAAAGARFTVFPGFADDHHVFARALEIIELTRRRQTVKVLLPGEFGAAIRGLVGANSVLRERIGFLPALETTCSHEAIIGESLDRLARTIHEKWLQETQHQIAAARGAGDEALARRHETKATFRQWDELSEEQKGASRSQADHIPFKIRAVGLDPAKVTQADWGALSEAQIEVLARLEHARWAAYYWMTGWTFAAVRDDGTRQHPDLVPYDSLNEPTKDYDRAAGRNLAGYLSR
ncbi:MAG: NAD-binding protein [Verrucomicrobia bacterium]|nr:NAD-binding protein [Verrucomicrobiota bacterium]